VKLVTLSRTWLLRRCFKSAVERKLNPVDFVEGLKKQGKRVPGIGHRIKSKDNRDMRVELLQNYAKKVSTGIR
jgi:ATP citrate (pro-S)-lyase